MPALSVIVPVYNVKDYLGECVESLLQQDFNNYEVILVDDGSTDGSGNIADALAAGDARITVIHQENAGLGAARNTGIKAAKGEFVQFVDSDDWIEENTLGGLVSKMQEDRLDVLRFAYRNVTEQGEPFQPYKESNPYIDYRDSVCSGAEFLNERLGYACYAVQFMIRRTLLEGCLFRSGMYFEDTDWTPRILLKAERVTSTHQVIYNYRIRSGSITQAVSKDKQRKLLEDSIFLIGLLKETAKNSADRRWFDGMTAHTAVSVIEAASSTFWEERKALLQRLKALDVFPLSTYHASHGKAKKMRWANLSPRLACLLLHIKNR